MTMKSHRMDSQEKLDDELEVLINALRNPDESIWDWRRFENGVVSVLMIQQRHVEQAERMIAIGLAGGEGRAFDFERSPSGWALARQSRWVG